MAGGMSIVRISKASGYKPARISYLLYGSGVKPVPKRIRPAFADAVMSVEPETSKVDSLATSRRLQALSASGYTMPSLAKRLGVSKSRVEQLANRRSPFVMRSTHLAVAELYGELSMVVPVGKTRGERQGISHAKSTAAAKGWLPPLAWNDIDDPDEQPTDWQYRPPTRAELIADLDEQGVGITDVCKALGVTPKTFERWCVRHDEWDRFKRIRDRERPSEAA
jgi:transcriptional regulator with XRE-family HTH domain